MRYLVCGLHFWSKDIFNVLYTLEGVWKYIDKKEDLTLEQVKEFNPTYIFFLHWSYIVPDEIVNNYECICFHPTHLPYGRGGTPIQNLIKMGHNTTTLTMFKMTPELDAGPVYMRMSLPLGGSAQEIYVRMMQRAYHMIIDFLCGPVDPVPQKGTATYFTRRTPKQSELPKRATTQELYDHIRMLDAWGYPHAFIKFGNRRFELTEAKWDGDDLVAKVRIKNG